MQCPRCRAENREEARFCRECGATFSSACPSCGAKVEAGSRFCDGCGAPLAAPSPPATRSSHLASPESYTPKHLAEKILTSKAALEGERKQVTVLFADLKGSMELLADRDPEEARKLLDPVLERMMEAVHRYEGTVNQVMGDGIMALFGAPLAHEDHAVRACYAALRMQEAVAHYAEAVFSSHGVPIQIRVGLNSGEVVVRAIGSDLHMDYTAVGQTTHLAARMEQMATPGTIMLAPATLQFAEGYVQVAARGPVVVKGLADPVEVYALIGASAPRTRLQAAAERGFTRFVGRDVEIEQLRRTLALAHDGHGQLVTIVGEPGVGKSRLVYEFTHSHRTQDWRIVEASSVSYGRATSYLPVIDLLKGYFKVTDRDTHREIREKITGKLLTRDEGLSPLLPPFLGLLDVPVEDQQWTNLDPQQRRKRTLDAVKRLLLRESQVQPLLVVFEDLQWSDSETQALLDGLVESLPAARLLVLVSYRPEYRHGWGSKTYYTQLRLDALPAETARELLEALLGRDPTVDSLRSLLAARTGGNPLFLEESLRSLVEMGALAGERGGYRQTRAVEAIEVPSTVQAILAARIDRLVPGDKRLLQTAAVVGKDVPFALLQAIVEEPEESTRQGLGRLQAAEFLYEARLFPDLEYTFKHALTLEVAYGTLLLERRREIHQRVLTALESRTADGHSARVETLAHHARRGEVWDRAARYLYSAGERAVANGTHSAAIPYYEAAIEALERIESRANTSFKLDALLELWVAKTNAVQFSGLRKIAAEAETLGIALGDSARLARIRLLQAEAFAMFTHVTTDLPQAITHAREAAMLAEPGDLRTRGYAQWVAATTCRDVGTLNEALTAYEQGEALFLAQDLPRDLAGLVVPIHASLCSWRAETLALLGRFREALDAGKEGVRIASTISHAQTLSMGRSLLGHVYLLRGDPESAVPVFESGLLGAEEDGVVVGIIANAVGLAAALALTGDTDRAADFLTRAEQARPAGARELPVRLTKYRAMTVAVFLAMKRIDEALAVLGGGLELAEAHGARGYRASLLRLRGEAQTEIGLPEAAIQSLQEGLILATEIGQRAEMVWCCLGLGRVCRARNEPNRAKEYLEQAAAIAGDVDMPRELLRIEREISSL